MRVHIISDMEGVSGIVKWEQVSGGEPLFEDSVMATCGTGCWGVWEIEIPYEVDRQQFGAVIVWEFSAQDGSRIHIREYPVQLR